MSYQASEHSFNIKISKKRIGNFITSSSILSLSFLILYGLVITVANDVENYVIIWEFSREWSYLETFTQRRLEPGSLFILWGLANLFSAYTTIYLTGLIALSAKFYLFNKYLNHGLIAYFLYVIVFAHILDANQLRAALTACVILYAIFVNPKSKYTYLYLTVLAMTFHYSGIILAILYFVRMPFIPLIGIILLGFIFDILVSSYAILGVATVWLSDGLGKVSLVNSFFIMQLFISIICGIFWKTLSAGQKRGALLVMAGTVTYIAFLDNPIVAHRVRELSQLGIFGILFLGDKRLSLVKIGTTICFGYILVYNLILISQELINIFNVV